MRIGPTMQPSRHQPTAEATGLDAITSRAALDPTFRRALLDDPREAIAHTFGIVLPPTLRVKFVEKEPGLDLMVILPDPVAGPMLDATELGSVSGGAHQALWILSQAGIAGDRA
jgi:hypothetical protein